MEAEELSWWPSWSNSLWQEFMLNLLVFTFNLFIYRLIGTVGRVFANGPGDLGPIPGRVIPKTLKMVRDTFFVTRSNIRYVLRVKWSNPGKGVAPPTYRWRIYWKGRLLVAFDYCFQLDYLHRRHRWLWDRLDFIYFSFYLLYSNMILCLFNAFLVILRLHY